MLDTVPASPFVLIIEKKGGMLFLALEWKG